MTKVNIGGKAAAGAVGIASALAMVSGCGMVDTGVRVGDSSNDSTMSPVSRPPTGTGEEEIPSVDPVEVLREDPGVPQEVKDMVAQPCSGSEGYGEGWFPLYSTYTTIAGTDVPVVVIDVQGCADVVACSGVYASYVYRIYEDHAERVYTPEEPMSQVTASGGELSVRRPIWGPNDSADCPTGSDMVRLTWDGSRLEAEGE